MKNKKKTEKTLKKEKKIVPRRFRGKQKYENTKRTSQLKKRMK